MSIKNNEDMISDHYTSGRLIDAISSGIKGLGKTEKTVTIDDLGPVDEFHIGERQASKDFLDQLNLKPEMNVLDIGCGLGGPARFTVSQYQCNVKGIDLTQEFVEVGNKLSSWFGLLGKTKLEHASAVDMPFNDNSFDAAYMIHVGMNIQDKASLCKEAHRVLKEGGYFGIYDVMLTGDSNLKYPVPWAEIPENSFISSPEVYKDHLIQADFAVRAERNRREFALEYFAESVKKMANTEGPPPLGLHLLMGETRAEKMKNMVENISSYKVAPVEIIAEKTV